MGKASVGAGAGPGSVPVISPERCAPGCGASAAVPDVGGGAGVGAVAGDPASVVGAGAKSGDTVIEAVASAGV
jgi:hypothetical protein